MTGASMPAWLQVRFPKPGREAGASDLAAIWKTGAQLVLSLLIVTILVGLAGGVMSLPKVQARHA